MGLREKPVEVIAVMMQPGTDANCLCLTDTRTSCTDWLWVDQHLPGGALLCSSASISSLSSSPGCIQRRFIHYADGELSFSEQDKRKSVFPGPAAISWFVSSLQTPSSSTSLIPDPRELRRVDNLERLTAARERIAAVSGRQGK